MEIDAGGGGDTYSKNVEEMSLDEYIDYLKAIASKWLKVWEDNKVYEADPDPNRPKYFLTAAFMYPNGPAHIGHARTYVIPDVIARFKRALGYNVLFPMGFHYTGTPIISTADKIASGDLKYIKLLANAFGVSEEELRKLKNPLDLARYFHRLSKEAMRAYGLSIDWRREFTTIDPEFKSFIRWQFSKLRNKGYLTRGSHPVGWCPRDQMPVGMHDTKDDVEPEIGEVTIIKFTDGEGRVFPAATLRPETVLGVTNLWVNPDAEYCLCEVEGEEWILACKAAWRLSFQLSIKVKERFKGESLLGAEVINPVTGKRVKVLQASFVNPGFGTGVVMSVPAHAPYDYIALRDLKLLNKIHPIPLIIVKGFSEVPAADVVAKLGIKSQNDRELLDKATKEVYREEFINGVMRDDLEELVVLEVIRGVKDLIHSICGKPVREARERIREFMIRTGYGRLVYELMNAPVYCRCGSEVVVKLLRNQWFLNYGDEGWKQLARELLKRIRIIPERARNEFEAVIEWLRARACARSRGLGTELPWEKGWIIESLSDSTIYMAFYTVIHKIRGYGIKADKLDEEFWDYIFLGRGDVNRISLKIGVSKDVVKELRREFTYWYPLDSRHSGKDLIPNHLTFFIFNHAAIFPRDLWPKQIVANGWVLVGGEKMSKSKGNIKVLHGLVNAFSPDIVRLAMTISAEVDADFSFTQELINNVGSRLKRIEALIRKLYVESDSPVNELPEKWLLSRFAMHVENVIDYLGNVRVRAAGIEIFYMIPQDIEDYLRMIDHKPSLILRRIIEEWLKLISIYTPFLAEELWHQIGKESLIVKEKWISKQVIKSMIYKDALLKVEFVRSLIRDLNDILKVLRRGREAVIYVAPRSYYSILLKVADIVSRGGKLSDVIKYLTSELRGIKGKELVRTAKSLLDLVSSMDPRILNLIKEVGGVDEAEAILDLKGFIERETGLTVSNIYVSTDSKAPDLGGKKRAALPWRPGIYIKG